MTLWIVKFYPSTIKAPIEKIKKTELQAIRKVFRKKKRKNNNYKEVLEQSRKQLKYLVKCDSE